MSTSYYNKTEVNDLIAGINQFKIEFVDQLPSVGNTLTIYFVAVSGQTDAYDEYMYVNDQWEQIGTTRVDLSPYYTSAQVDSLLNGKANQSTVNSLQTNVETLSQNEPYYVTIYEDYQTIFADKDEVAQYGDGDKLVIVNNPNAHPYRIKGYGANTLNTGILQPTAGDQTGVSGTAPKQSYILLRVITVSDTVKYWYPTLIDGGGVVYTFGRDINGTDSWFTYDTSQVLPYKHNEQISHRQANVDLTNFQSLPVYNIWKGKNDTAFNFNESLVTGIGYHPGGSYITQLPLNGPTELTLDNYSNGFKLINLTAIESSDYSAYTQILFVNQSIYYRYQNSAWVKVGESSGGGSGSSITLIDSDTIKVNTTASGTQLVLATDVVNNITKSLKAPVSNVTQLELVGIEANSTEQTMRAIGGSNTIQVSDDGETLTFDIKAGTVGSWQPEIANVGLLPIFATQLGGLCGVVKDTIVVKTTSDINISKTAGTTIDASNQILGLTYLYDKNTRVTTISNLRCASSNGMSVQFITGASCTNNEAQTKFKGDDCSNNVFTPQANTAYEVFIWGQQTGVGGGTTYYTGIVMNKGAY